MNSAITAGLLLATLIGVVWLGRRLGGLLPQHHLSGDSKDAVKLAVGLVVTMTALLLGLLVSSAKATYDNQRTRVIEMAAKVAFLDRVLALYGPETADVRGQFRVVVAEAVRGVWPDEPNVPVNLTPNLRAGEEFYDAIQRLSPRDDAQRGVKEHAAGLAMEIGQRRALLVAQSTASISKPLLLTVICWLAVIFLGFSMLAPPNATTTLALLVSALSVTAAIFLILELDRPFGGLIRVSSEPMLNALSHLGK